MSQLISPTLEVTRVLLDRARATRFQFGSDTALVAVQHMLLQTVDLFANLIAMGLEPKNIVALGKIYSNNDAVIRTLRDQGVTVVPSTMPKPGEFSAYFQRDVERLWQVATEQFAGRRIKRILVLDDGGVCITNAPAEILRRYAVCGVEQTSQGVFLFEEKPPAFPVISWARSAVKLQVGGAIFSQCFVEKLNSEFLHGRSISGKQLGIIGLGSIGGSLAKLAVHEGIKVLFYDSHPEVHIPESLRGLIDRANSLEELMLSCDYIAGCSGRNPFANQWPMKHRPGIKLLSASGGDQEFRPIIKDLKVKPDFAIAPDTWTITSDYGPSGPIEIAYLGFPYNFVSRSPEAVPTRIVQLETGGLLTALIQARLYLELGKSAPRRACLHRSLPKAQRFVYDEWLKRMNDHGIDLIETFAYERELLKAAKHETWFAENTEPTGNEHDHALETAMARFVCSSCAAQC